MFYPFLALLQISSVDFPQAPCGPSKRSSYCVSSWNLSGITQNLRQGYNRQQVQPERPQGWETQTRCKQPQQICTGTRADLVIYLFIHTNKYGYCEVIFWVKFGFLRGSLSGPSRGYYLGKVCFYLCLCGFNLHTQLSFCGFLSSYQAIFLKILKKKQCQTVFFQISLFWFCFFLNC